jgi:hypothetical protein
MACAGAGNQDKTEKFPEPWLSAAGRATSVPPTVPHWQGQLPTDVGVGTRPQDRKSKSVLG